jgi:glycosyltransferase involved in cell wall biosynthesis
MKYPTISVVFATYNGSLYLRQQADSIISQLLPDDELIFIDDCSVDGTLAILKTYVHVNVRLLVNNANVGPVTSFQRGLIESSRDIVVLSDQDDVWLPDRLELVRRYFSNPSNPAMLSMDGVLTDEDLVPFNPSSLSYINAGTGFLKNLLKNRYIGCHLAFRRQILDIALPFPPGIPMHDIWLGLIAEVFYDSYFLRIPTIYFRRHSSNFTPVSTPLSLKISWRMRILSALALRIITVVFRRYSRAVSAPS